MVEKSGWVGVPGEIIDFYRQLKVVQAECETGCSLSESVMRDSIWPQDDHSLPLIKVLQPKFEQEKVYEAFLAISSLVSKRRPELKKDTDIITELPKTKVGDIVKAALEGDFDRFTAGGDYEGVNFDILRFIIINSLKPFLSSFATTAAGQYDLSAWHENYCPVCGSKPGFGKLKKEDGKRHLCCSLCDTEWLYKRLACPNCGNEDHRSLLFLMVEETPGYQIDVCNVCNTYLKVIDERKALKVTGVMPEIETLYLDVIAQEKGYRGQDANA